MLRQSRSLECLWIDYYFVQSRSHRQHLPALRIPPRIRTTFNEHLRLSRTMVCPTAGHYRLRPMEEYSSLTTIQRPLLGLIREPGRRVLPRIKPVYRTDLSSIRSTIWDHSLMDGKKGFIQMEESSSSITVCLVWHLIYNHCSNHMLLQQTTEWPNGMTRVLTIQISLVQPFHTLETTNANMNIFSSDCLDRQTCQTSSRSKWAGTTYLKTLIARFRASVELTYLRLNFGLSLIMKKFSITVEPPGSGFICSPKKCLIRIMVCSSTRQPIIIPFR